MASASVPRPHRDGITTPGRRRCRGRSSAFAEPGVVVEAADTGDDDAEAHVPSVGAGGRAGGTGPTPPPRGTTRARTGDGLTVPTGRVGGASGGPYNQPVGGPGRHP